MPLPALLGPALTSFAPTLLSGLGLFGPDPQKKLRKQIAALLAQQGKLQQTLYKQSLASPAFSQAQGSIATGANVAGADIARNLAQRGLGTSGVGAIVPGLVSSLVGSQQAGLRTAAFQSAQDQAQNQIQQKIQTLMGTSGPSQTQQFAGVGLEAFLPFLQQYLGRRSVQPVTNLGQPAQQGYA